MNGAVVAGARLRLSNGHDRFKSNIRTSAWVPRSDRLAGFDGSRGRDLPDDYDIPQGRTLFTRQPIASRSRLGAFEYCRGTWKIEDRRLPAPSLRCRGIVKRGRN